MTKKTVLEKKIARTKSIKKDKDDNQKNFYKVERKLKKIIKNINPEKNSIKESTLIQNHDKLYGYQMLENLKVNLSKIKKEDKRYNLLLAKIAKLENSSMIPE